jgi:hypothetical protein
MSAAADPEKSLQYVPAAGGGAPADIRRFQPRRRTESFLWHALAQQEPASGVWASGEARGLRATSAAWPEAEGSGGAKSGPAVKLPAQQAKRRGGLDAPEPSILDVLQRPSSVQARGLYKTLRADSSEQALRPKDPAVLFTYVRAVGHAVTVQVPKGTKKKDVDAWKHWRSFTTELMGTAPLRRGTMNFGQREHFIVGAYIVHLTKVLKSTIPGRAFCKPESYMAHAYGIKRVHNRHGVKFNVLFLASGVFRALCNEYGRRHGPFCA